MGAVTSAVDKSRQAGEVPLPRRPSGLSGLRGFLRRHGPTLLLLTPLVLYFVLVFAAPMGYQIAFAFWRRELYKEILWKPTPDFQLGNFVEIFQDAKLRFSIAWTVGVALLTTSVGIALALPVAYYLARGKVWGRSIIELSFLLPIFGEFFTIYALAYALTPQGPVNWLLLTLHIVSKPIAFVGSPITVIVWMSLPTLSVLLIRSAFAGVDVVYEEAAQTMGASAFQTFLRVSIPLARNGIAGAFLLGVSGAVGAWTLPTLMIGAYNDWLTTKIVREIEPYFNYPKASALGVILTAICVLLLYLYLGTQEKEGGV